MGKTRIVLLAILMVSVAGANAQSAGVDCPATDGLGRRLPTYEEVGDLRSGKTVAMFYWTWHSGLSVLNKAYDLGKIIADHPEMINDYTHPLWDPYSDQSTFFWTEPLFGFYDGKDKWVIRKQLEMLGAAGVDVLFFDATNGNLTWKEGYEAMGEVMAEARADGVAVPQFAFMLNFSALPSTAEALVQLYDELYSLGKYQDSWFIWQGKPVVMAYPDVLDNPSTADTAGLKFTADSTFSGISVNCPSYNNNTGDLTLSLYAWNGTSYAGSVSQPPLASQTFVNFNDNAYLTLEFAPLAGGAYVWELSDAREVVGVWKYEEDTLPSISYFNGIPVSGDYAGQIKYVSSGTFTDLTSGISLLPVEIHSGLDPAKLALIKDFFTFRPGQPAYEGGPSRNDQWGWLENAPQNGYAEKSPGEYELVTVGVAQNWSESANQLSAMNGPNIHGRSYTASGGFSQLTTNSYLYGYNFQEQWDHALAIDPDIVFITGWNEWIVGRAETWEGVENAFPDQFDKEHSRDIEPMKGGYGDNYYYQMISNIRKFKGMHKPEAPSARKTIAVDGDFSDWMAVRPEFAASRGNVQLRDGYGYIDKDSPSGAYLHYTNTTGRNDIIGSKVARDGDTVYFHVTTAAPLTSAADDKWMQLFIDVDRNKATGWEGYDFMIGPYAADGTAVLKQSSGGWNWTEVGRVEYRAAGSEMEIAIPQPLLGLPYGQALDLEFKWMDNVDPSGDIMVLYTDGETAPGGRFNYRYTGSAVIFQDTFNAAVSVWDNLNTELATRQAAGITNSTYTLGLASGRTLIGPLATLTSVPDPVLLRVNTSGGGGGVTALDLDCDFGSLVRNSIWSLGYKGRFDASVEFSGWTGFAVGNPANTPLDAGTGFGFNLFPDGIYQVWNKGSNIASVALGYPVANRVYDLSATFDELAGTVLLNYSDAATNFNMGPFPTAFVDGSRFVELRNYVNTSAGDGIVDLRVDDLAIQIVAYTAPYAKWAAEKSLAGSDALRGADPDVDGLDNLVEYAFGGNPKLADATSILPTSAFSADWGSYVYHRRRDATVRGLGYGMAFKLDLLDPEWIFVGTAWETGSNPIDASFESVTNEFPLTGLDQGFIHLEIMDE